MSGIWLANEQANFDWLASEFANRSRLPVTKFANIAKKTHA